jgi:hypothetical protein
MSNIAFPTIKYDQQAANGDGKFHYEPTGVALVWKPGCGAVRLNDPPCPTGLFLDFTRAYIDLTVTQTVTFDADSNTLTVMLDTWSKSQIHPMVATRPQEDRVEESTPHPMKFSAAVVDWTGKQLWAGEINEVFAE